MTLLIKGGAGAEFSRSDEDPLERSESDSSSDSTSYRSVESAPSSHEPNNRALQRYYDEVVSIIDKLFDVSILIRGASRNFRTSRAAAHVETDAEGNDVLSEFKTIVSLKIRGLCPETPEWLVERLAKVITMRRQQFYYQRAHKKHLTAGSINLPNETQPVAPYNQASRPTNNTVQFRETTQEREMTSPPRPSAPKTSKSGTTMMTYDTIATELELQGEPATTTSALVKLAPSEKRIGEDIFPKPPKDPPGKAFECSQCFHILPAEVRKIGLWRSVAYLCLD